MAQKMPDLMPCTRDGGLGRSTDSAVAGAELGSVVPTMWAGAGEEREFFW